MMLSKAAVSCLWFSRVVVTAWAPRQLLLRTTSTSTTSTYQRNIAIGRGLATQLHAVATISTEVMGTEQTESFRLSFQENSSKISPWHDIPMKNKDGTYNMVRI
jgi:hypothetical protein